jgi:hypothetical protein
MSEQKALVLRGTIDCPTSNENFLQQGRAASFAHIRKARVGETVTLSVAEFVRLEKLGAVTAVR